MTYAWQTTQNEHLGQQVTGHRELCQPSTSSAGACQEYSRRRLRVTEVDYSIIPSISCRTESFLMSKTTITSTVVPTSSGVWRAGWASGGEVEDAIQSKCLHHFPIQCTTKDNSAPFSQCAYLGLGYVGVGNGHIR